LIAYEYAVPAFNPEKTVVPIWTVPAGGGACVVVFPWGSVWTMLRLSKRKPGLTSATFHDTAIADELWGLQLNDGICFLPHRNQ